MSPLTLCLAASVCFWIFPNAVLVPRPLPSLAVAIENWVHGSCRVRVGR